MTHALIVTEADRALLKLLGHHPALERALERGCERDKKSTGISLSAAGGAYA